MPYHHVPVMLNEVLYFLDAKPGDIVVDGTLGGAGHATAILTKIVPAGILIGIDQDHDATENAAKVLKPYSDNIRLFHGNFIDLPDILSKLKIDAANGILLDLGVSLHQIKASGRGFSFNRDEPLDMRMDLTSDITAEDFINTREEAHLSKIFKNYGEERWARQIARRIVRVRKKIKIRSSRQLSEIICDAIPGRALHARKIHPATRTFMALRIAVNRELERLETFLNIAPDFLKPAGRLCVLSFHSLEDRLVKNYMKAWDKTCTCPPEFPKCVCKGKKSARVLTRRAVRPTPGEIAENPLARSTRLRACEKL